MSHRSSNLPSSDSETLQSSVAPDHARRRAVLLSLCVLVPLAVFGLLAEDIASRETIRFDDPFLLDLHAHASPLLDSVMLSLSRIGGFPLLVLFPILCALLFWRKQRVQALFFLSAMVGICLLNIALKTAFQRTRPDLWLSIAPEHDFSFPSGHSMLSSTFVLALLALAWHSRAALSVKWTATVVGLLFVFGVICSRLYLGVHYPSDVLAGFCLSLSWISLLTAIFRRRLNAAQHPLSTQE